MLLTERFDEGLALLQRMLQWDPIDMTYCKMLQTKKGETRWDGKPLENVPKISDLAPEVCVCVCVCVYVCVCVLASLVTGPRMVLFLGRVLTGSWPRPGRYWRRRRRRR